MVSKYERKKKKEQEERKKKSGKVWGIISKLFYSVPSTSPKSATIFPLANKINSEIT